VPAVLLATAHIDAALGACDLAACQPADIVAAYTASFGADNCGGATDQTAHQYSTGCDTADCTKDQLESKFGACGVVQGCIDALAFNYNPAATVDDGSCVTQAATTYQAQRDRYACETGTSEWETITDSTKCADAFAATGWEITHNSGVPYSSDYGPAGCYVDPYDDSGASTPPEYTRPELNTGDADVSCQEISLATIYGKRVYRCLCAYTGAVCPNTDGTVANTLYTYDDSGIGTEATCGCGNNAVCAHGEYCLSDGAGGTCHDKVRIFGCTEPEKHNYNPTATTDTTDEPCLDNTCPATGPNALQTYNTEGVSTASNCACDTETCAPNQYCWKPLFAEAQCSDEAPTVGCTNPQAGNYNPDAEHDDGSCNDVFGCTNPIHDNYNQYATTDDGSCESNGCTTSSDNGRRPVNYRPIATVDDGSCVSPWTGMRAVVATITSGTCTSNGYEVMDSSDCYTKLCAVNSNNCNYDQTNGDLYIDNQNPDHGSDFPRGCYKYLIEEGGTDYYYWYNQYGSSNACSSEKVCYCDRKLPKCLSEDGTLANTLRSYDQFDTATNLECACADTACPHGQFCTVTDSVGTCSSTATS